MYDKKCTTTFSDGGQMTAKLFFFLGHNFARRDSYGLINQQMFLHSLMCKESVVGEVWPLEQYFYIFNKGPWTAMLALIKVDEIAQN